MVIGMLQKKEITNEILYLNLYINESEGWADDACHHRLFILRILNQQRKNRYPLAAPNFSPSSFLCPSRALISSFAILP